MSWPLARAAALAAVGAVLALPSVVLAEEPAPRWRVFATSFEAGEPGLPDAREGVYGPGRVGRALRLGPGAGAPGFGGVVDLTRPGAITAWVRPSRWLPSGPRADYVPAIRVLGRGPASLVVERDRRYPGRRHDVWIAGFFSVAGRGDRMLVHDLANAWSDESWHFVAFQWDATGFALRLDGAPDVRVAAQVETLAREFPAAESTLVIGGASREGLWVDELAVWSRPLSERELAQLWLRPES
jgi:hypothetical protein